MENRVDRKVDKAADKGLDEVEEGIEDTVSGDDKEEEVAEDQPGTESTGSGNGSTNSPANSPAVNTGNASGDPGAFKVNTKFDYVPGSQMLVYDDFSGDAMGDFPARWNTDGTGEIVTLGDSERKWFQLTGGSKYIPDLPQELPESYTIEFDITAKNLTRSTSSGVVLEVMLDDNNNFRSGKDWAKVRIPFCQYAAIAINVENHITGGRVIYNNIDADIRQQILAQPHISIAVNKTRFRMWVNDKKYVDVPRLMPAAGIKYLKFLPHGFKQGREAVFISNLKIAEGGLDLRGQLLKEGKVSTNGILFDVNSANIKPESYGIIRQIALAMEEKTDMRLNIIGHTDSDGEETENQSLSEKRAASVKNVLVNDFGIKNARLEIEGRGESQPIADNQSPEAKAANRRVEFVTL